MKKKNWIEMLIGLAEVRNSLNDSSIAELYRSGSRIGIAEDNVTHSIRKHVNWCRKQGYAVVPSKTDSLG